MNRWLIILGVILVLVGVLWPLLAKLNLFHLPGDIAIERKDFRFYFPITTMIVISVVVSIILWLLRK